MLKHNQLELIWTILCRNISVDSTTNTVSLFNIVEEIQVNIPKEKRDEIKTQKEGFLIPLSSVLSIFLRKLTSEKVLEIPIKIETLDPRGKNLGEVTMIAKFDGKTNLRMFANLNNFKVTESGKYIFRVLAKNPETASFIEIGQTSVLLAIS